MIRRHRREASVAIAIVVLAIALAVASPSYFSQENLLDVALANLPVALVALGVTLVVVAGEIDISVGSVFAITAVMAGVVAKWSVPGGVWTATIAACLVGAAAGMINGSLVAYWQVPSIVVTLATMVALRAALRWVSEGAWVQNLPAGFQWFGLSPAQYTLTAILFLVVSYIAIAWMMRHVSAGRMVYAIGSSASVARLSGMDVALVKCSVFLLSGALTALAAVLNAVRFNQIPSNGGLGLELKVIAAVVLGGASITGGRGTFTGTLLGVVLLGAIGPALTFLGVSAYWERAIQGAIILTAVGFDAGRARYTRPSSVVSSRA